MIYITIIAFTIVGYVAGWLVTGAQAAEEARAKGKDWEARARSWEIEREALIRRALIGEGFAGYVGRDSSTPPRAA
jgi:hypothetical protein